MVSAHPQSHLANVHLEGGWMDSCPLVFGTVWHDKLTPLAPISWCQMVTRQLWSRKPEPKAAVAVVYHLLGLPEGNVGVLLVGRKQHCALCWCPGVLDLPSFDVILRGQGREAHLLHGKIKWTSISHSHSVCLVILSSLGLETSQNQ